MYRKITIGTDPIVILLESKGVKQSAALSGEITEAAITISDRKGTRQIIVDYVDNLPDSIRMTSELKRGISISCRDIRF